ncbi:MAG: hypothetical protein WD048_05595 [Chitinophagales bacterium]
MTIDFPSLKDFGSLTKNNPNTLCSWWLCGWKYVLFQKANPKPHRIPQNYVL